MSDFKVIRKYICPFTRGVHDRTDFEAYANKEDFYPKNNIAEIYCIIDIYDLCFSFAT